MLLATLLATNKCIGEQMLLANLLATNKCVGEQIRTADQYAEYKWLDLRSLKSIPKTE